MTLAVSDLFRVPQSESRMPEIRTSLSSAARLAAISRLKCGPKNLGRPWPICAVRHMTVITSG